MITVTMITVADFFATFFTVPFPSVGGAGAFCEDMEYGLLFSYGPLTQTSEPLHIRPVAQSAFAVQGPKRPTLQDPVSHIKGGTQSSFPKHGPSKCDLHTRKSNTGLTQSSNDRGVVIITI
jgi:hypothetical protein